MRIAKEKGLTPSMIHEAYRYLHKLVQYEEINGKVLSKPVFWSGFFGAGKTEATLLSAWLVDVRRSIDKVLILAYPLRALRDDKYKRLVQWGARPFLFKAHDEVCKDLKQCLQQVKKEKGKITRRNYFSCLKLHIDAGNCTYKHHVDEMKEYVRRGGRVIVTTHLMSRIAKLLFPDARLVVDEAEDYLLKLSEPIPRQELDIVTTDKKLGTRIKRYFEVVRDSYGREYYVIKREGLRVLFARDATYISATIPPSLLEYFGKIASILHRSRGRRRSRKKALPPLDIDPPIKLRSKPDRDILIILNKRLAWRRKDEWYPNVFSQLLRIAQLAVDKYGVLGVLSRNKEMTRDLVNLLRSSHFKVWADIEYDPARSRDVYTRADIVILTVKGPLYRGRSVFSVKRIEMCRNMCKKACREDGVGLSFSMSSCYEKCYGECQKDFPVVVAFYQGKRDKIHPFISEVLEELGGKELYRKFRTELLQARNLQALYRFNRERGKEHIMILFDERFADAYRTYFDYKFRKELRVLWINEIDKVYDMFSALVKQ